MTIWQTRFREILVQQNALSYNLETERLRKENLDYIHLVSTFTMKVSARNQHAYEETLADIIQICGEE